MEKIRITGSDHKGQSLIARTDISIKSLSNISVLFDEFPVEVYYHDVKVCIQAVSHLALANIGTNILLDRGLYRARGQHYTTFLMKLYLTIILSCQPSKLLHRSSGIEFRALEIPVKFQPENSRDRRCKEFIAKYITTGDSIEIALSIESTVIKLASCTVSIPRYRVFYKVDGMDKQFLTGCTGYISILRTFLTQKLDFTFTFGACFDSNFREYLSHPLKRESN